MYYLPNSYSTPKWQARIVNPQYHFHFHEGPSIASMWDLKRALPRIPDDVLAYHVNDAKNDLSDWIQGVIQDTDLAEALRRYTDRWGLYVALERHLLRSLNLPPHVARRWLAPAHSPFRFVTGREVGTLTDLATALSQVDDEIIDHHLSRTPNDIAHWVDNDLGDYDLSDLLEDASNRSHMYQHVNNRLQELNQIAHL